MMRAARQQAGKAWRIRPLCDTVNMLVLSPGVRILLYYSWLATGSAPRMVLISGLHVRQLRRVGGDQRARRSPFRTTLEVAAKWVYMRHMQLAFSNHWLLANIIDTRMPFHERVRAGRREAERLSYDSVCALISR